MQPLTWVAKGGRLRLIADETLNDSDKTITVPTNKRWYILSIWIEYAATATVGTRTLEIQFRDNANDIFGGFRLSQPSAGQNTRIWLAPYMGVLDTARPLANDSTTDPNISLTMPLPELILDGGMNIRIADVAAVDPAADDMIIQMLVLEWDV